MHLLSHLASQSNSLSYYAKKEERNGQSLDNLVNRKIKFNHGTKFPEKSVLALAAEIRELFLHRDYLLLCCHQCFHPTDHR